MTFHKLLEAQVQRETFSLRQVIETGERALAAIDGCVALLSQVERAVSSAEYRYLVQGLVRASFLIELVKEPKIETTKFEVRWATRLPKSDPRHASYAQCCEVFKALSKALAESVGDEQRRALCRQFMDARLVPYELPLDYRERLTDTAIHRASNLIWLWGDDRVVKAVALRGSVMDPEVVGAEAAEVFGAALRNKIKVKTYLTDRALTGVHKTNREKRWEVHPASVHFGTRVQCLEIERELIQQLCFFQGFPAQVRRKLLTLGLLTDRQESRCPITLGPLRYDAFVEEIKDPDHGKANFQVGHLNPLKADPGEATSGHTAANIAWISADGNRIQGSYSLKQTRTLLREIAGRYGATGWQDPRAKP